MDETKYGFQEQFPRSVISIADMQSTLKGLHQMDLAPLRPSARRILDEMEYSTDAAAQAKYSGTGVTITKQAVSGSLVQEGSYSLKAVIDGTNNRSFSRAISLNLTGFAKINCWHRASVNSSAIQFYLSDGTNSSYWDITTHATNGTWAETALTLASPSSNSGSPANLAAITSYGYRLLDNGVTYYFDTIEAIVGMSVAIDGSSQGAYFKNVYASLSPLLISAQAAPVLTAPTGNPRIDILTLNTAGTLAWVTGTEATTPTAPWASVSNNVITICEVYLKVGMVRIVEFDDKAVFTTEGYILSDCRPFVRVGSPRTLEQSLVSIKTDNYTLLSTDVGKLMLMNAGTAKAFTLPAIVEGTVYFLKNIGSGVTTITPNGADTTELATLKINDAVMLVGDSVSAKWRRLNVPDLTGFVLNTGNETIAGTKTFSTIPLGPASDPTTDNQLTRKAYVDASSKIIQAVNTQTGAVATGTTTIPYDDTIPQNTEGTEFMTLAITPTNSANKLKIEVVFIFTPSASLNVLACLFQDSGANALACAVQSTTSGLMMTITFIHYMTAGTTSSTTFKVRAGGDVAGTVTFNGGGGARKYGGVLASSMTITEIKV